MFLFLFQVDKVNFTVEVPGRPYKFEDQEQKAATWVERINTTVQNTST